MRILAIDPGTNCGFAWSDDGKVNPNLCDCVKLTSTRTEGAGMRFVRFERRLKELVPNVVFYELVMAHKGTVAAHIYGGIVAILQKYCEEHNIPYRGLPVGTIKKHATGKGNADKAMMIASAQNLLGYHGNNDNEADALWILHLALDTEAKHADTTSGT